MRPPSSVVTGLLALSACMAHGEAARPVPEPRGRKGTPTSEQSRTTAAPDGFE